MSLRILSLLEAAMPSAKVIEPPREPTHPPGIPVRFGEGQGLPDLPLIPSATGPVMPFDDTGIHLLIAQQVPHVFEAGFAIEGTDLDPLDPPPLILFVHLPIC